MRRLIHHSPHSTMNQKYFELFLFSLIHVNRDYRQRKAIPPKKPQSSGYDYFRVSLVTLFPSLICFYIALMPEIRNNKLATIPTTMKSLTHQKSYSYYKMRPKPENEISPWYRTGDFNKTFESGSLLNRHVIYNCADNNSFIDKIEIAGYSDGGFQIIVTANDSNGYKLLSHSVEKAGFSLYDPIDALDNQLRLHTNQRELIILFFETICKTNGLVGLIKDEIVDAIAQAQDNEKKRPFL